MDPGLKFVFNFAPQLPVANTLCSALKISILPTKGVVKTRVKEQRMDRCLYTIMAHYKLQVGLHNKCIL